MDEGSGLPPEVVLGRYKDNELKTPGDTPDKELDAPTALKVSSDMADFITNFDPNS